MKLPIENQQEEEEPQQKLLNLLIQFVGENEIRNDVLPDVDEELIELEDESEQLDEEIANRMKILEKLMKEENNGNVPIDIGQLEEIKMQLANIEKMKASHAEDDRFLETADFELPIHHARLAELQSDIKEAEKDRDLLAAAKFKTLDMTESRELDLKIFMGEKVNETIMQETQKNAEVLSKAKAARQGAQKKLKALKGGRNKKNNGKTDGVKAQEAPQARAMVDSDVFASQSPKMKKPQNPPTQ